MGIKTNQFGFTLVEALVGGALLAGLGLMGARIFSQQSENVKFIEAQELLNTYHGNLRNMLTEEYNCNAMLSSNTPVSSIATINSINICCPGGPSVNPSCTIPIGGQQCRDALNINPINKTVIIRKNDFTDESRRIRLDDIRYYDPATNSYVPSLSGVNDKFYELHLTYQLMNTKRGVSTARKIIPLALSFSDKGIFKGCSTSRSGSNQTSRKEICLALNGILRTDGAEGEKLVEWVENIDGTGSCVPLNKSASHGCPSGNALIGLTSTGDAICRPTHEVTNPADILGGGTCTTGSTVRFVTVGNKIKLECI